MAAARPARVGSASLISPVRYSRPADDEARVVSASGEQDNRDCRRFTTQLHNGGVNCVRYRRQALRLGRANHPVGTRT